MISAFNKNSYQTQPNTLLVEPSLMAISLSCVGIPLAGSRRSNPHALQKHLVPVAEFGKISTPGHPISPSSGIWLAGNRLCFRRLDKPNGPLA